MPPSQKNSGKLRWGLLSTARINRAVIHPLRLSERSELAAVASRTLAAAQSYAQEWEIPAAYGSYEELLADPDIDVIYNPLPNALHAEWTIRAAEAGKHVLCEKPLALRIEEVDAVANAAQSAGVVVAEAFMYRQHPQTLKIKEMLSAGEIGEVYHIQGVFTFRLERPDDVRWSAPLGGGSIWDIGCYPISYARTMLGEAPEELFGYMVPGEQGVDAEFSGLMRFPSGALAQIHSSFRTPYRSRVEINGSLGSLVIPAPFNPGLDPSIELHTGGDVKKIPMPGMELYLGEVEDMADAVLEGKTPRISLEDSRANVAAIQGLLASAHSQRPVRSL
jgi:D-xylose 1-dehydrogenase (NADP+, D-xylono-1,5-lactone-forming)